MKAFISQPMRGKTIEQINEERKDVTKMLEALGFEVADSVLEYEPTAKNHSLHCLGKSLQILADCDVLVYLLSYSSSRGCCIEKNCAESYGIPTLSYGDVYNLYHTTILGKSSGKTVDDVNYALCDKYREPYYNEPGECTCAAQGD